MKRYTLPRNPDHIPYGVWRDASPAQRLVWNCALDYAVVKRSEQPFGRVVPGTLLGGAYDPY